MKNAAYNLIVVLGPTATGKTRFSAQLAHRLGGEIISADSRQVYRRMNLGTGKDYEDYQVAGQTMPTHLIDICDPGEKYDVYRFQHDFYTAFSAIQERQVWPILCGGTGMYIEAVTQGYQLPQVNRNEPLRAQLKDKSLEELEALLAGYKALHNHSDTTSHERALRSIEIADYIQSHPADQVTSPKINPLFLGLQLEREGCRERIYQRLHERLEAGMVDEVRNLLAGGLQPEDLIYYGLEYKFVTRFITGEMDYDNMVENLFTAICQFSKRQRTWFRRMKRQGTKIHWIDALLDDETKLKQAHALIHH